MSRAKWTGAPVSNDPKDMDNPDVPSVYRGDFICSDCEAMSWSPHEGMSLDPHNEEVARCADCHIKNFVPCESVRCCA